MSVDRCFTCKHAGTDEFAGTPLYGGAVDENGEIDALIIRSGVFEDQTLLSQCAPVVEMFTSQRLKWVAPVEGCLQFEGMLPSQ